MRDASRIKERRESMNQRGPVLRGALGAVMVLVLTFSLGMIVGKQSAAIPTVEAETLSLADLKEAQKLREDLKFYRRLTETAKPAAPEPDPTEPLVTAHVQPKPETAKPSPKPVAESPSRAKVQSALSRLSEPTTSENTGYTVQVSSFPSLEEAEAYRSSLVRKGYSPYVVSAHLPGRGTWFRVRIGRYSEKSKALLAKDSLGEANIPGWVLQLD